MPKCEEKNITQRKLNNIYIYIYIYICTSILLKKSNKAFVVKLCTFLAFWQIFKMTILYTLLSFRK